MKIVKSLLVFVLFGVISIIALIMLLILFKPFGIDIIKLAEVIFKQELTQNPSTYDHPYLDDKQEAILQSVGINPADIPTTISPAQEQCAIEAIGKTKVDGIKAGASPSLTDVMKLKDCL